VMGIRQHDREGPFQDREDRRPLHMVDSIATCMLPASVMDVCAGAGGDAVPLRCRDAALPRDDPLAAD
jgi:hypothetical protein